MFKDHQWMPNTLFDMAAFCEKNNLEKPRDLLIETAMMLRICLNSMEANRKPDETEADVRRAGALQMLDALSAQTQGYSI